MKPNTNEPRQETDPEELMVLVYRCSAHAKWYPGEDPLRPYTEFTVDPVTLLRTHDTACNRCVRRRRQELAPRQLEMSHRGFGAQSHPIVV